MPRSIRLGNLSFGALCRIGTALSAAFWVPPGALLGIAAASGAVPLAGVDADQPAWLLLVLGVLQGVACSVANEVAVVIAAAGLTLARWRGPELALR